jgi:hypothetical protein
MVDLCRKACIIRCHHLVGATLLRRCFSVLVSDLHPPSAMLERDMRLPCRAMASRPSVPGATWISCPRYRRWLRLSVTRGGRQCALEEVDGMPETSCKSLLDVVWPPGVARSRNGYLSSDDRGERVWQNHPTQYMFINCMADCRTCSSLHRRTAASTTLVEHVSFPRSRPQGIPEL